MSEAGKTTDSLDQEEVTKKYLGRYLKVQHSEGEYYGTLKSVNVDSFTFTCGKLNFEIRGLTSFRK